VFDYRLRHSYGFDEIEEVLLKGNPALFCAKTRGSIQ
jgi:hypothetical protein